MSNPQMGMQGQPMQQHAGMQNQMQPMQQNGGQGQMHQMQPQNGHMGHPNQQVGPHGQPTNGQMGKNNNNNGNDDDDDTPNDGGGNQPTTGAGGSTAALIIGVGLPVGGAAVGMYVYQNYFTKVALDLGGEELSEIEDSDFAPSEKS